MPMAYKAGAMIVAADQLGGSTGAGLGLPTYGTGQAANTWYGAPMVDANGKEIPWVDSSGSILEKFEDRFLPPPGTAVILDGGGVAGRYQIEAQQPIADNGQKQEGICPALLRRPDADAGEETQKPVRPHGGAGRQNPHSDIFQLQSRGF